MEGGRKGGPRDFEKSSHALKASRIKIKSAALSIHHHPLLSSPACTELATCFTLVAVVVVMVVVVVVVVVAEGAIFR